MLGVRFTPFILVMAAAQAAGAQDKPLTRIDAQGDPLPAGALARLGTQRWRIRGPLLFSSNGRFAVVDEPNPWIMEVDSGKKVRGFDIHSRRAFLTPDDKTLIVSGSRKPFPHPVDGLYFLDVQTGKELRHLPIDASAISFSADGKRMASTRRTKDLRPIVEVWNLASGERLETWRDLRGTPLLSPDGRTIAFRDYPCTMLFDVADGKERYRFECKVPSPSDVNRHPKIIAFSADGNTIACSDAAGVTLWDSATGAPRKPSHLLATKHPIHTLALSADGRNLACAGSWGFPFSCGLYIWDLQAGKLVHLIDDPGRGRPVALLNFTPDGKTLISQGGGYLSARRWNVASGKETAEPASNDTGVDVLAFSPDSKTIATNGPGDPVSLWNARNGKLLQRFPVSERMSVIGPQGPLSFSPSGKLLAMGRSGFLSIWDLNEKKLLHTLGDRMKPAGPISFENWQSDDDVVLAVWPGEVKGRKEDTDRGKGTPKLEVVWFMIGLSDARTKELLHSFRVNIDRELADVSLGPDGRTVVGRSGHTLFAWDLRKSSKRLRLPTGRASFSADGRTLFLTTGVNEPEDHRFIFHLYEVASWAKRATVEHKVKPRAKVCAAIANERLAAFCQDDEIKLFDPITARELGAFKSDGGPIECVAFSPDGKLLASAGADTTVLVWDIAALVPPLDPIKLGEGELAKCWADLLAPDAEAAFRTIQRLCRARGQTVAFLDRRLEPAPAIAEGRVKLLIERLGSARFAEREQAMHELRILGELAEDALVAAAKAPRTLEWQRRAETVLKGLDEPLVGEPLREARVVEVLERIASAEATALLARLAKGSPHSVLTREAQVSLQRLAKRLR